MTTCIFYVQLEAVLRLKTEQNLLKVIIVVTPWKSQKPTYKCLNVRETPVEAISYDYFTVTVCFWVIESILLTQ